MVRIGVVIWLWVYTLTLYKFITYQFNPKLPKGYWNDSLVFLYIINSPQYTILFLCLCIKLYFSISSLLSTSKSRYSYITITLILVWWLNYLWSVSPIASYISADLRASANNHTLQNGLLNIHSSMLYVLYAELFIISVVMYTKKNTHITPIHSAANLNFWISMAVFSILLGSLWASQEFNWGGFWSWDPVELVSLLIFFFLVVNLHKIPATLINPNGIKDLIFYFIIIYSIVRLGALTTIHAFVSTSNNAAIMMWSCFYLYLSSAYLFKYGNRCKFQRHKNDLSWTLNSQVWFDKYKSPWPNIFIVAGLLLLNVYFAISIILLILLEVWGVLSPSIHLSLANIAAVLVSLYLFKAVIKQTLCNSKRLYAFMRLIVAIYLLRGFTTIVRSICSVDISTIQYFNSSGCLFIISLYLVIIVLYGLNFYVNIHTIYIVAYTIFFFFFVNVANYVIKGHGYQNTLSVARGFYYRPPRPNYELGFFIKNHILFKRPKHNYKKLKGFNILTNVLCTEYCLVRGRQRMPLYSQYGTFVGCLIYLGSTICTLFKGRYIITKNQLKYFNI